MKEAEPGVGEHAMDIVCQNWLMNFSLPCQFCSHCIRALPRGVPSGPFRQEVSELESRVINLKANPDGVVKLTQSQLYHL